MEDVPQMKVIDKLRRSAHKCRGMTKHVNKYYAQKHFESILSHSDDELNILQMI